VTKAEMASSVGFSVGFNSLDATLVAADGYSLSGSWFLPNDICERFPVVVVACGAGIPARYYTQMARFLASKGMPVLTFDYRGIGASRRGSMKDIDAGVEIWAELDLDAALVTAGAGFPRAPLCVVAHSFGGLLIGAAASSPSIERIVFLAPHTGYWGDYRRRWRWLLYATWHVFMPITTKLVGYFPGRTLRLGEDLPGKFALDWAGRRHPTLINTAEQRRRFGDLLARFRETRASALALTVTDDAFAPLAAGKRLISLYPNLVVEHESVAPIDLRRRKLGHMAFVRQSSGMYFWERVAAWFLLSAPKRGADASDTLTEAPASRAKGFSSAGFTS
jgi:predicted alpha/beta hydrolase